VSDVDPRDSADVAWLEARERGAPVLPPIDPVRATGYAELLAAIETLPDDKAPVDWEAEVMSALPSAVPAGLTSISASPASVTSIEAGRAPTVGASADSPRPSLENRDVEVPRSGGRRWLAAVATVAAAAAGLFVWLHHVPDNPDHRLLDGQPDAVSLSTQIIRTPGSRSGGHTTEAALGDVLRAVVIAAEKGELRIYRDDRDVVVRCPGQAECAQAPERLTAELRLTAPGRYRAVYFRRAASVPSTGTLDGDLNACGCASSTAVPIVVR